MQIRLNTDNHINGRDELAAWVEREVAEQLHRFLDRVTDVVVYLADENSNQKSGPRDHRCTVEAHVAGLPPVAVKHHSEDLHQAFQGALAKAERMLDHTLGRLEDKRRRDQAATHARP